MATPQPAAPASKPTLWIVIAAVSVVVAIGLLVWALSVDSDLDTANDHIENGAAALAVQQATIAKQKETIAQQKTAIATADSDTTAEAKSASKIEKAQIAEYNRTRRLLSKTKRTVASQQKQIAKEQSDVRDAQQQVDEAETRNAKLAAEANLAKQKLDVALACQRGTIDAIDSVFSAPTAKAGVNRLTSELSDLAKDCHTTVGT
jgi:membrane protein involved in colicin uptake